MSEMFDHSQSLSQYYHYVLLMVRTCSYFNYEYATPFMYLYYIRLFTENHNAQS